MALMACMAATATGCGHSHSEREHGHEDAEAHAGEITVTKAQARGMGLQTETVAETAFRAVIPVSGQLLDSQGDEQTVAATSSGIVRLANASVAEGTPVGAGQAVAYVSARDIQDGDPALKAKAAWEAARDEYIRAKALVAGQIVSQREFAQIRMQYETARVAYEAQARRLTARGVAVLSPAGGYIKRLQVAQGEYVQVGQPIATVTRSRRMQLRADVPVNRAGQLSSVTGANFRMAGTERVYRLDQLHGRVVARARSVDGGSPFVTMTFELDNVGDMLAGAFAEVWLLAAERQGVVTLPVTALTEEQGVKYVYVQTEPETYVKREVATGGTDGLRVEITGGLEPGDRVVTKGAVQVRLAAASAAIPAHSHNH